MDIDWHIGDVITKLRKRARMNQTTLALKVGVNKATIVRAEDGDVKVSRETYLKIAHVLKTDIAALEREAARLQAEQDAGTDVILHRGSGKLSTVLQVKRAAGDGNSIAEPTKPDDQTDPVPPAAPSRGGSLRARFEREVRAYEQEQAVDPAARPARTTRKPPAATHPRPASGRVRDGKPRR
jgi:DNA-binding XRE family transcriptional regulator